MVAKNEAWYHQVDGCYRDEGALTREERRQSLNENFNFHCQCVACQRSYLPNPYLPNFVNLVFFAICNLLFV